MNIIIVLVEYGPALIEHVFLLNGLKTSAKIGKDFRIDTDLNKLYQAVLQAEDIMNKAKQHSSQVNLMTYLIGM